MAAGIHWERRAFGVPPLRLLLRLRQWRRLDLFDDLGNEQIDDYLWFPGMPGNIKIRDDCLKFKRLLRQVDGFELWTERGEESFGFPLSETAADFVRNELACSPPGPVGEWGRDVAAMKAALARFDPPVIPVRVRKCRIQYRIEWGGEDFLLELTEVLSPCPAFSIAVETEDFGDRDGLVGDATAGAALDRLRGAVDSLELPGQMEVCGYLQMLERWSVAA